ncbi:hypothetical protein AAVH_35547 [Aphelenchoides avenae]|nr:hypothetical protein AAVH_35547 [Aphelenchus avenae]
MRPIDFLVVIVLLSFACLFRETSQCGAPNSIGPCVGGMCPEGAMCVNGQCIKSAGRRVLGRRSVVAWLLSQVYPEGP